MRLRAAAAKPVGSPGRAPVREENRREGAKGINKNRGWHGSGVVGPIRGEPSTKAREEDGGSRDQGPNFFSPTRPLGGRHLKTGPNQWN